jgi:hypothetical protein
MLQQTQPRAPPQRRSLSACRVADEAGKVSDVEEEETKEGISDNANWNDNDDELENVVLCDMDGVLQPHVPHVPQQSQPLPELPSLLSAGNLLRRRNRARHQETKGQLPMLGFSGSQHLKTDNLISIRANRSARRAAYGFHARGGGRRRKRYTLNLT